MSSESFPQSVYVTISKSEFDALMALPALLEKLARRVAELEEKLGQNSTNSSKPPSSDPPGTRKKPQRPSGQSKGGQPGHKGKGRALFEQSKITRTKICKPSSCAGCGHDLAEVSGSTFQRAHVMDLPQIIPDITEFLLQAVDCPCCGQTARGELPAHAAHSAFGPGVIALLANLTGRCRMSRRDAKWLLEQVLDVQIGLGTLPRLESIASDALGPSYAEVKGQVPTAPVLGVDDSAWKERKQYKVGYIASTPGWALIQIEDKKDHETAKAFLAGFSQTLVSDRGSTYSFYSGIRQTCLSHTDRHFLCMASRGESSRLVGRPLLDAMDQLWSNWKSYRNEKTTFEQMSESMVPIQGKMFGLLLGGTKVDHKKTAKTCRNFLNVFDSLWEFTRDPAVPPTNNDSERGLRPLVRLRKNSFGSQSEAGTTFTARILTAAETCRRRGKNLFNFLKSTVQAHLAGLRYPLILAPD